MPLYPPGGVVTIGTTQTINASKTLNDGVNIILGTSSGSQLGSGSTQKLGLWGATPVAQIAGTVDVLAGLVTVGMRAASSNPPLDLGTGTIGSGLAVFANGTDNQSARMSGNTGALGINGGSSFTDGGASGGAWVRLYGNSHASLGGRMILSSGDILTTGYISLQARGNEVMQVNLASLIFADAVNVVLNTTTGTKIGTATGQKLAFHNSTPVVQRVGAAQAAVVTTGSTITTPFGYTTAAQADAIVTLVNELRAAMVEKGLIKGSA